MVDKKLIIQPKTLKGEDGYHTFSVRVKKEIVQQMDEIALVSGRSRNELVGLFLAFAIEHCRVE